MEIILFVFIGLSCLTLGVRTISAEERNKIFNKRPIRVKSVQAYNRFCGGLIIGFGIVAEITVYFMVYTEGIVSTLCTLGVIAEAFLVMTIYNQVERRMLVQN